MMMNYDKQEFYRAHLTRDIRFDGKFFVAVKTTKIYCRPICPARKAKLENLEFFIHAVQAEEAGYRPCLRCRPETAPGSAAWIGTSATVRRAIRMMDSLAVDSVTIEKISENLGVGERWLRELFKEQVGINPQALLLNKKLNVARNLLDHANLSITDIAFSSGFNSIRRFNDAFKKRFKQTPSSFKKKPHSSSLQCLYLSYRPPFSWDKLLKFFAARTIPAIEIVDENSYQRLFVYNGIPGWIKASLSEDYKIKIEFKMTEIAGILGFVAKIKDLFDLDADPMSIEKDLKQDAKLKPLLKQHEGLRIPGCWSGFELAIRAVIGQKISVKAARTILTRLVALCGEKQSFNDTIPLTHFFPTPKKILETDLSTLGLTTAKMQTVKLLAKAVHDKHILLDGTDDYEQTCNKLLSIKGIGPWTVEYIALRGLKNPDAFPETDLELQKKIKQFKLDPQKWIPWRAYAAILLFNL